jgi:phenylpyruvate tautomerase PptA (4-oxalocrotonate tautomerase family)
MSYKIFGDSCLDLTEELKKDPKVVTVSVHDVPAEKWQEHLDAIPGEERFY